MTTVAELEATADAGNELAKIQARVRDDVLTGETKAVVQGMGLESEATEATNDANTFIPLHHAYDGRVVSVPLYMLNQLNSLLSTRFPTDNSIPSQHQGQRVWFSDPQTDAAVDKPYMCALSENNPDEVKARMKAAGMNCDCRKPARYATTFEAEYHFERKHPRRFKSHQRYLEQSRGENSNAELKELIAAFTAALGPADTTPAPQETPVLEETHAQHPEPNS